MEQRFLLGAQAHCLVPPRKSRGVPRRGPPSYIRLRRRGVAIQEAPYQWQVMHGTRSESDLGGHWQASDETAPSSPTVACGIVMKTWMRAGGAKEEGERRMVP